MTEYVTVHTMGRDFEVDPHKLAENLKIRQRVAKFQGLRPGQPANLTHTASDPISHEKFGTLATILDKYQK